MRRGSDSDQDWITGNTEVIPKRLESRLFGKFPQPEEQDGQVTQNPVFEALGCVARLLNDVITSGLVQPYRDVP